MGDKTQLLSFVLAAQFRKPWAIIAGILVATLANHFLAGGVGYLMAEWIPRQPMLWIVGFAFVVPFLWSYYRFGYEPGKIQSLILAAAIMIVGVQVALIGLLADAISGTRKLTEDTLYRLRKMELDLLARDRRQDGN